MEKEQLQEVIKRIERMEMYFDILQNVSKTYPDVTNELWFTELLDTVTEYYESKLWIEDYEADEKGLLSDDLKRGILSQDGFYNFITSLER